jgi:hypothetical protein
VTEPRGGEDFEGASADCREPFCDFWVVDGVLLRFESADLTGPGLSSTLGFRFVGEF